MAHTAGPDVSSRLVSSFVSGSKSFNSQEKARLHGDHHKCMQGRSKHSSAPVTQLRKLPESSARDKDRLIPLIKETLEEGGSVLVFCGGRAQTQSGASLVTDMLQDCTAFHVTGAVQCGRQALVQQLQTSLGQSSNTKLENMILHGEVPHVLHVFLNDKAELLTRCISLSCLKPNKWGP